MAYQKLKKGDTGNAVKRLQKHLKHVGYYSGEQTGTFDDATEIAVKAFQKANNLAETGVVDSKTLSLLATKSKEAGPIVVQKAPNKPLGQTNVTVETGRWNNHKFIVSAQQIMSFTDISIKGSSATESKDDNKNGFISRKGSNPTELSVSLHLNAQAGVNVRDDAMKWVSEAQHGAYDYFYLGDKKLIEAKMMLTDASVSKLEIAHNGTWVSAEVSLTFKQSDGSTSSGSSSSGSGGGSGGGGGGGYSGGGGSGYSGSSGSQKLSVNSTSPITSGAGLDGIGQNNSTANKAPNSLFAENAYKNLNTSGSIWGKLVQGQTTQQAVHGINAIIAQKNKTAGKNATQQSKLSGSPVVGAPVILGYGGPGH